MRSNGYSQKIFKIILIYVLHNSKIVTTFALETYGKRLATPRDSDNEH